MGRTPILMVCAAAAPLFANLPAAHAIETVHIDGSSTVFPITEAVAEDFQAEKRGTYRVTVGVSGTGGGFKKFCRGDTDISDASRPIKKSERERCAKNGIAFIELPVALDALAVVVNPGNTWVDHLTVAELKTIWEPAAQGKIDNWHQVRASFPDRPLTLFGPGVDSGTYDYFTKAIVGKEHESRGDFTASEDDNILVQGVAGDVNALGFFGLAYYTENRDRLKAVPIVYKGGTPVLPSVETAATGSYQPLSRPIFIYVSKHAAETKEAVDAFVRFYLEPERARSLVAEVGYVPLPREAYELALKNYVNRHTGSAFTGGSKIGVSITDLLAAEKID